MTRAQERCTPNFVANSKRRRLDVFQRNQWHQAIALITIARPVSARRAQCYNDEGKRCAETLFFDYHRRHGLDVKVARIFNTYGPHMHPNDGRVVSNFIRQALEGEPITLFGDGE